MTVTGFSTMAEGDALVLIGATTANSAPPSICARFWAARTAPRRRST
jgi:hypothetical protein